MKQTCAKRWRLAEIVLWPCLCMVLLAGCRNTPQLGDAESLAAADGLWTAITARQPALLDASAGRIEALHDAGKISDDAYAALDEVIITARGGNWSEARAALKKLVRGQRPAARL